MTSKPNSQRSHHWLSGSMMNLLVDYYTEVPFRPYGSGATRENVLPWLKQLDLGYICIYAKGHSGYTTWPSPLKTQHPMLAQDMPRFFRDITLETGTKLVLYYSGLLDGIAGQRHPDWVMRNPDGTPNVRYFEDFKFFSSFPICPLSDYWEQWAKVQLAELLENYDPDGIWVDGDWPGPCYCPRCQARFRADTGWAGPWDEVRMRPDFAAAFTRTWNRITHGWRMGFNAFIKSVKPDCAYSAGNVSPRREFGAAFDWRSGDFFSPGYFQLHDMARVMRRYTKLGVPYDAYICDTSFTHVRPGVRSRTKTLDRMLQEAATMAATGAAVGYWTYPLGNGAFVPSRLRKAAAVRRFLKEREELFIGSTSAARTAILASDPADPALGGGGIQGAHKVLAALHRSPDIIDETGVTDDSPYELIVLPEQAFLDKGTARKLETFVRRGGTILSSGSSIQSSSLRKLLGVDVVRKAALTDGHVLLWNQAEPVGVDSAWDQVAGRGARELYPLYLSWDQLNPECRNMTNNWPMHGQVDEEHPESAGFPAAIYRRLGKGVVAHVATAVFDQYRQFGDPQMLSWLREIVEFLQPMPLLLTHAPSWVDVSLRRKDRDLLIHFVNQNSGRDVSLLKTDDIWVDEIPEVGPYQVELRLSPKPSSIWWEPDHRQMPFVYRKGIVIVELPRLRIHGCLRVKGVGRQH